METAQSRSAYNSYSAPPLPKNYNPSLRRFFLCLCARKTGLGGGKALFAKWVVAGYRDIRDVKCSEITAEQQLRIHRVTGFGEAEVLSGAKEILEALP